VERLSAQDLSMIWPQRHGWPQDIGAIGILDGRRLTGADGRVRMKELRSAVAARLPFVPRFGQVIHVPRPGLGRRLWVDAPRVDLDRHVRIADLPDGAAGLLPAVERIRRHPLDMSRPLWEIWLFTGLGDERLGLFVRVHHAITDGVGGVSTLATLLGTDRREPTAPAPVPSTRDLFVDNVRGYGAAAARAATAATHPVRTMRALRADWPALRESVGERTPRTSLNKPLGTRRSMDLVRSRLDLVKDTAHAYGGTVNDVLLAAIAGGLRDLLLGRGEEVDGLVLRAFVPVALHRVRSPGAPGNEDGQMVADLPVGLADPAERLRAVAADTAVRRQLYRPAGSALFRNGLIQRAFLPLMAHQRWANTYVANVPGPADPLTFAGSPLLEVFPLVPLIGNVTLGVGALSYAGQFNVTVVADATACPDATTFVTALRRELRP
jgi:diacylglycerol O-acyltransferase / wax synthase